MSETAFFALEQGVSCCSWACTWCMMSLTTQPKKKNTRWMARKRSCWFTVREPPVPTPLATPPSLTGQFHSPCSSSNLLSKSAAAVVARVPRRIYPDHHIVFANSVILQNSLVNQHACHAMHDGTWSTDCMTLVSNMPCPALPCPALRCPALPCPALPCHVYIQCGAGTRSVGSLS